MSRIFSIAPYNLISYVINSQFNKKISKQFHLSKPIFSYVAKVTFFLEINFPFSLLFRVRLYILIMLCYL